MNFKHFYTEQGTGFPLILLHGNSEDQRVFKNQIPEFSKFFHVYALDTRGHGKSPRGTAPFKIEQFAEDLKNFLDEHHIKKAHFLGFSDGGNILEYFAIKYPSYIDSLVLNGANYDVSGLKGFFMVPVYVGNFFFKLFSKVSKKMLHQREMMELMIFEPNLTPKDLSTITAKTLVLFGTHDIVKKSHEETLAASIPNSKLVYVDGPHGICYTNPKAYNQTVLNFLTIN